jgi:excisionase family DNA binding protein
MEDEKMDYDKAANFTGLPIGTLYSFVSRKCIPHFRHGPRLVRFSKRDLQAWIDSHKVLPDTKRRNNGEKIY